MRIKTAGAAVVLVAVATGCSATGATNAPFFVKHGVPRVHAVSQVHPARAHVPSARELLAAAVRKSLSGHTVGFDEVTTVNVASPDKGSSANPVLTMAGVADFDHDRVLVNGYAGPNALQPQLPLVMGVITGATGVSQLPYSSAAGHWVPVTLGPKDTAAALVNALADATGAVTRVVSGGVTHFVTRVDLGRRFLESSSPRIQALGQQLVGQTAREDVWVDRSGRITRIVDTIDFGRINLPGVPSVVKSVVDTTNLTSYGVDVYLPPHGNNPKVVGPQT